MNLSRSLKKWKWLLTPAWWLERQINRNFTARIKEATARKDQDEIRSLKDDYHWNLAEIRDSRQARIQKKWVRKAQKFMIPLPPQDSNKIM